MCSKRSSVMLHWRKVILTFPDGTPAFTCSRNFRVDACLRDKIKALLDKGVVTVACCCGHGKYPETIVVRRFIGNQPYLIELNSGIPIRNRTVRIYKRDAEGFYYIPEVQKYGKA